jgi:hypothetical protein
MPSKYHFDGERMPYGRHEGCPIHHLPADYLRWIAKNLMKMGRPVRGAVLQEAHRRFPREFPAPGGRR